jgi:hypothetical protein
MGQNVFNTHRCIQGLFLPGFGRLRKQDVYVETLLVWFLTKMVHRTSATQI